MVSYPRVISRTGEDITEQRKNLSPGEIMKLANTGEEPRDPSPQEETRDNSDTFTKKEAQEGGLTPMAYSRDYTKEQAQEEGLSPMAFYGKEGDQSEVSTVSEERSGFMDRLDFAIRNPFTPMFQDWNPEDREYERTPDPSTPTPKGPSERVKEDIDTAREGIGDISIDTPDIKFPEIGENIKYIGYAILGFIGVAVVGYFLQGLGSVGQTATKLRGSKK